MNCFFVFDGIDGVGKSTQLERFVSWLRTRVGQVVACRDPGSTPLGEQVRKILLHCGPEVPIDPRSEMLLYMAARTQLVEQVIRPALQSGKAVVSDRYLLANLVYQGHAGGVPVELIRRVGEVAVAGVTPDATFLLDMDPLAANQRLGPTLDRMESRGHVYRQRLRQGFLAEAARDPQRIRVIDAAGSIEDVEQAIRDAAIAILDDH